MANDTPVERVQIQATGIAIATVKRHRQHNANRQRQLQARQQQRAAIGAEPIGRGVAERVQLAVADHEIGGSWRTG